MNKSTVLVGFVMLTVMAPSVTWAGDTGLADNIFETADKDKNQALDEEEFRKARSVLRASLERSVTGIGSGGMHVVNLANGNPDGDSDGKVTLDEMKSFVQDIATKRDEIVKQIQKRQAEELAAAKQRQAEWEKQRREQQKRLQEAQKKNAKKNNKKRK